MGDGIGDGGCEIAGEDPVESIRSMVMEQAMAIAGPMPTPMLRSLVCPYCGVVTPDSGRCSSCSGRFDPLSRQATQNQMGPWFLRDDRQPHRPGCTYQMIARLIEQQAIGADTVLRGPTTRQFWMLARHTPGVAHLLGRCHSCHLEVDPKGFACPGCHAQFSAERDRQHLGLGPSRPLPGQGLPEVLAMHAEPASHPENGGAEVASTPIGAGGSEPTANGSAGQGGAAAVLKGQPMDESARLARRWKRAWESERRRVWIVLGVSATITLVSLGYAIRVGGGGAGGEGVVDRVGEGTAEIFGAVDE